MSIGSGFRISIRADRYRKPAATRKDVRQNPPAMDSAMQIKIDVRTNPGPELP